MRRYKIKYKGIIFIVQVREVNDLGTITEINEGLRKVSKEDTFSTVDVKRMLGVDDREMRTLCKKGQISLKKDIHTDRTFFLRDDVEMLKKLKSLHLKTAEIEARKNLQDVTKKINSVNENMASSRSLKAQGNMDRPIKMLARPQEVRPQMMEQMPEFSDEMLSMNGDNRELKMLIKNLVVSQENVVKRITKVLDEKLEGMDEVVVELIRCKTENEKMQQQVNKLTKENYALKSRMASYKPVGFGLYIKKQEDSIYL